MTRRRILTIAVFVFILVTFLGFWWTGPRKADMATYAPANALLYIETNDPLKIAEEILATEASATLDLPIRQDDGNWYNRLYSSFVGWTGIGSATHIILERSQVALVLMDLAATEEGDVLNVKASAAILIETHTSKARIRPVVEEFIGNLAERVYQRARFTKTLGNVELLKWQEDGSDRGIVVAIDGSLVIVGTDERAVNSCLAVRRGKESNLKNDPELGQMRLKLNASDALAFGYVSATHSSHLLSRTAPLFMGRPPGDLQFENVITGGATKLLTSVGWSSHPNAGGIEDRYIWKFNKQLSSRLRVPSSAVQINPEIWNLLPSTVHSATIYNYKEPANVWSNLEISILSQVDTLAALLVVNVVKAALMDYGIKDLDRFLKAVQPELLTARLTEAAEQSLLIARVRDKAVLNETFSGLELTPEKNVASVSDETSIALIGEYIVIGATEDVRQCVKAYQEDLGPANNGRLRQITHFHLDQNVAGVMTYTDDSQRVQAFVRAIGDLLGQPLGVEENDNRFAQLPYSASQTIIGSEGIERRTQSSFGQFSSLLPILIPLQNSSVER